MDFREHNEPERPSIVHMITSVFSDAEGKTEGELIGRLAQDLFTQTPDADLLNFVANDNGNLLGSIFFSRLAFENANDTFIMAPVAVHSDHHGEGIGQALIAYGLNALKTDNVEFVLTYGDPRFYEKVGFKQISTDAVKAPLPLSQPEGWLGQSLCDRPIESLSGIPCCVDALNDPVYW